MIHLTNKAAEQIKKIFEEKELPLDSAIRFGVKGGGCAGFEYTVDVEKPSRGVLPIAGDQLSVSDHEFHDKGIRIIVDSKSLLFIDGMLVDWKEHNFGHSFEFSNPNSSGTCGCGISFTT